MLMVILFHLYLANISSNRKQLNSLPDVIPVEAKIVNLNGSQEVDLSIKDELIQKLENSSYVDKEIITVRAKAGIGEFSPEEWQKHLKLWVLAINSIQAIPDLDEKDIIWKEGENSEFLQENETKCIVDKEIMEDNNWSLGDTIPLYQYYYSYGKGYEVYLNPLDMTSFEIIGYVQMPVSDNYSPDIVIPFQTERTIYLKNEIPFFADSASFTVANPLQLNDFKKEMKNMQLLEVVRTADFSHDGIALSLRDSTFITAASKLQQEEDLLTAFFPFIFFIMIGIGYIASFLLLQGRKEEIAVMRSIGVSSKICFFIMAAEHFIVALIGVAAGSIGALIGLSSEIMMTGMGAVLVLGCYMAGTCAALRKIGKISVMDALTQVD